MQTKRLPRRGWIACCCIAIVTAACSSKKNRLNFSTTPPAAVVAGVAYSYQANVTGTTNPVTWTLSAPPTGMAVSSTGLVTWSPTAGDTGSHAIVLNAVSGRRSGVQRWTLTVQAATPLGLDEPGLTDAAIDGVFHAHWRDSLDRSGEVPLSALAAAERARQEGATIVYAFTWTDRVGYPDLVSAGHLRWNSWQNPETRADFVRMLDAFVTTAQPRYLFLGNEVDPPWAATASPEWSAWLEIVGEVRDLQAVVGNDTTVLHWPAGMPR